MADFRPLPPFARLTIWVGNVADTCHSLAIRAERQLLRLLYAYYVPKAEAAETLGTVIQRRE